MIKCIAGLILIMLLAKTGVAQTIISKGDTIICNFPDRSSSNSRKSETSNSTNSENNYSQRTAAFSSVIEVRYFGFPAEAEAAVQKAIDVWASTLKSDIPIRIVANWTFNASSPNTLAFVVPTNATNFPNNPTPGVAYPITLAEKLAQAEINQPEESDIVATFNSGRTDWYFGIDGNCPANKLDLFTVALHELGHGIGFSGTFFASTTTGTYGPAKIYDLFLQNNLGQLLTDVTLFPNNSNALREQITSGAVFFKSPIAQILSGGPYPKIFAPNPYQSGSSISHLDDATYPKGNINSLMTPFVDYQDVNHNPGPLTKGIFYEMGWLNTYLKHTDFRDRESLTGVTFDLDVKSDTTINTTSGKLYYSYDGFTTSNNVPLSPSSGSKWSASIPSPVAEKTISYYFTFSDVFNRVYRYPLDKSKTVQFYFGVDTKKPEIIHEPLTEIVVFQKLIPITATVTDNIGIQKVEVEYQINSRSFKKFALTNTGSTYFGQIDLTSENVNGGDVIKYRIIATDNSSQLNVMTSPSSYYNINVKLFETKTSYSSDFSSDKLEFYGNFTIGLSTGFVNGAIHSPHPYLSSTTSNNVDISYLLLFPIQVKTSPSLIQFDEVVLVEPVNDYVIVEGSKDNGITWKPLTAPYDSRKNADWLTYYNSGGVINGVNQAVGTLNYYRMANIDLLATFAPGDVIYIRFRLNSNNLNSAWGWGIDNLRINDTVTGLNEFVNPTQPIVVYPNPATTILNIVSDERLLSASAYSMTGQKLNIITENNALNVSGLAAGIYLLMMSFEDGSVQLSKIEKR